MCCFGVYRSSSVMMFAFLARTLPFCFVPTIDETPAVSQMFTRSWSSSASSTTIAGDSTCLIEVESSFTGTRPANCLSLSYIAAALVPTRSFICSLKKDLSSSEITAFFVMAGFLSKPPVLCGRLSLVSLRGGRSEDVSLLSVRMGLLGVPFDDGPRGFRNCA